MMMEHKQILIPAVVAAMLATALLYTLQATRKPTPAENGKLTRNTGESTMKHEIKELTDASFNQTIAAGVVLVDFWAPWCGPCRMQGPILEEVAKELGNAATIAKINIDEHSAAAQQFGVRSIPTLLLFKDGKLVKQFVGVQRKNELVSTIRQNL